MIEQYWIIDKYLYSKKDFSEKRIFITSFYYTFFFYKQSIFDPHPENCLSFSKKPPQKIV